jgi:uncharacterized protein YdcH (DUF465 family)
MDRKEKSFIRSSESRVPRHSPSNSLAASGNVAPSSQNRISFSIQVATPLSKNTNQVITTKQEIVPMDLHHPILREFPEHREVIRRLKGSNEHFRSVFAEYHRLDDEIYKIEEDIDFAMDQEIEELKMRRAKLKDYIYHIIRHAPPTPPVYEGLLAAAQVAAQSAAQNATAG